MNTSAALQAGFSKHVQCFAMFVPDELRGQPAVRHIKRLNACFQRQKELYPDFFARCTPVLTVEGGAALGGSLSNVALLRGMGVKIMTLTWNGANELAGGCMTDDGFTDFGRKAVREMENAGIFADVSHLNDRSFYQLCDFARRPFLATHSASRSVCNHPRNLTDRQFWEIQRRGGIVGLVLCDKFLREGGGSTFEDVLRHVWHFLEIDGGDTLALGTDFDGTDLPKKMQGVSGLAELYEFLLDNGISAFQLEKIFYRNASHFFEKYGGLT